MKIVTLAAICLALTLSPLAASDPNSAPKSDDPMAGLNLGGESGAHSADNGKPSPFVAQFQGHLLALDHGEPKDFDAGSLKEVKYWAFYYSASWCGPCQAFTPQLVEFYKWFKKTHPNFEVVLVGNDGSQDKMVAYMKADSMPWPSMKYPDLDQPKVSVKKYFGPGIPDLVLTDEKGKVLSDTFRNGDYVGPGRVIDDIKKMVPRPDGN